MTRAPTHFTSIFYNDPDQYPPIVNSSHLLAKAGYRGTLLCRKTERTWGVKYPSAITVQRLDHRSPVSWREFGGFVAQALRVCDPRSAFFIGHDMHGFLVARLLAARYRRPIVYHCHDFVEDEPTLLLGSRVVKAFERRFARTADVVIVPDRERASVVQRGLRLPRLPLIVANAPLRGTIQAGSRLRENVMARGFNFSKIVWRQGRIGEGHALEATLRSLPLWQDKTSGFVLMGLADEEFSLHLKTLSEELKVQDQFLILPPVQYDEVPFFTAAATVGHALYEPSHVNNQYITTASNKIMEYMAAGLPLLVSAQPGLRSLVKQQGCGVVADESDPTNIAAAINTLFSDPKRAQCMGQKGRRAFEEIFCYERQFQPVLKVLESFCHS